MTLKKCIICNSNTHKKLYEGIVKCNECSHIFANLALSDEEYRNLYNHEYFHGNEYSNYILDKTVLQKNFINRLNILKKYITKSQEKSLLEIGSAYGFFLEKAKDYFLNVEGVDITVDGINFAKQKLKLKAKNVDFLKWDTKKNKWDVICLWDTVEHLKRPDLFIKKASNVLNQDGLIAITTGDINSYLAKFRGKNWRLIHPPTHVHYFSKKSLTNLLFKEGFEIIHFSYPGFYRSLDNIFYNIFVLRLKLNWIYKILQFLQLTRLSLYFNTYDICYIIAKKIR